MSSEPIVARPLDTENGSVFCRSFEKQCVIARVFFTVGILIITLECFFYNKIKWLIKGHGLPVVLWPSEIWFICIGGLLFLFHISNKKMKIKIGDISPILVVILVFLVAFVHGVLNNNPFAISEFREIVFGAFALPIVMILAPYYSLRKNPKKIILFFLFIGITFSFVVVYETINMIHFNPIKSNAFTMLLFLGLPIFILANSFQVKATLLPLIVVSTAILINFSKLSISNFFFATMASCICFYFITPKSRFLKLNKIRTKMLLKLAALAITCFVFLFAYDRYTNGGIQKTILVSFLKMRTTSSGAVHFADRSGGRIEMWKASINLWSEQPFCGHGLGKTIRVFSSGWSEKSQLHNYFLQTLQNTGVLGVTAIFVSLTYWWLKIYPKIKRIQNTYEKIVLYGMVIFILTILFNGLYGHSLSYTPIGILFWVCIGLLSSLSFREKHQKYIEYKH